MDITQLLSFGLEAGASDCHLSAGEPPLLRVDGDLKRVDGPALTREEVHTLIYDLLSDHHCRVLEEHLECDFSFELGELARFRANVFFQRRGLGAVFRMIPSRVRTMADLGFPSLLRQLCEREKGLILVTGPTGCGKTTTRAAMLDHLNSTVEGHVLTIHQLAGVMQASQADGMLTMDMALQSLVSRGLVTPREARSRSMTPDLLPSDS
jgi:twitching motility protein PilT